MGDKNSSQYTTPPITVVITAYNQGDLPLQAVQSALQQTLLPTQVIVVDDGSTDRQSLDVLEQIQQLAHNKHIPRITVMTQENAGVSAARNAGIATATTPYVAVLDGDDLFMPDFLEQASAELSRFSHVVAVSSWLQCFGVLDAVVKPTGGDLEDFLPRNCCPAACLIRQADWQSAGGYTESMRHGFEDWDFFLKLLENASSGTSTITVLEQPLIQYRTAPASANIASMTSRTEILRDMITRHHESYAQHVDSVVLALDALATTRLRMWEDAVQVHPELQQHSLATQEFMRSPSFGDGGMAAAVRLRVSDYTK